MASFWDSVWNTYSFIFGWINSSFRLIRSDPFLLFTVGFVVLGYVIIVFGRLLNRE